MTTNKRMKKHLSQTWNQFRNLFSVEESLNTTIESGKAVVKAAKTFKEQGASIEALKFLLQNSSSLLDVLCSPLALVVGRGLHFVPMSIALLKLSREMTQEEPTLETWALIISQAAYLESVQEILLLYPTVNWDANLNITEAVKKQLQRLSNLELDEQEAKNVILCFHESKLAREFNQVLSLRLQATKFGYNSIHRLTQRIAANTHRYIIQACINSGDILNLPLPAYGDWLQEDEKFQSIDKYLNDYINQLPRERVFEEKFAFKDIYVPLKAREVDVNGQEKWEAFDLKTWAEKIIYDETPNKQRQVMFIQAGPGKGKSVFCRMFAAWVSRNVHPVWTPILIKLRDIKTFENNFEATLKTAVDRSFATSIHGLLNDKNTRFLFLLDGFDELLLERKTSEGLKDFLKQVGAFQERCQQNPEKGHQVLITGRTLALQGIERLMPDNLDRVEIQLMDDEIQQYWFAKWSDLIGVDKTSEFQQFLQNKNCPDRVRQLSQEPLLLYLLAAMHRDGEITGDMFNNAKGTKAKILIYQKSLDWVLTKQRPASLNREIAELEIEHLRQILKEAGLCVIQSGGQIAAVAMIEERLKDHKTAETLIAKARNSQEENPLRQALATFYLKQAANSQEGYVEFNHKSFGEFLCADKLKEHLEDWTQPGNRGREFNIETKQMDEQIYDLLGYGGLTPEIIEYLLELLNQSQDFRPVQLFKRLQYFYRRWCNGEFIDAVTITLPLIKAQQLQKHGIRLTQRQVDIYAGLNVMILLLELHRYSQEKNEFQQQIIFYPSRSIKGTLSWSDQLLRIINYSDCMQRGNFNSVVGQFLSSVNLSGADLSVAYLSSANLSNANLSDADLTGANLSRANLSRVNLSVANLNRADLNGADLTGANLSGANLSGADLNGVYLNRASLSGAYLSRANLSRANLSTANFSGADLSRANLSGANLNRADLSGADLSDTNLSGADLSGADLSGASLNFANLSRANLSGANLNHVNLSGANFSRTQLSDEFFQDIQWDEETNWGDVQGLETAISVPAVLKQQLGVS
ncbi:MAG: pentapeptide repeat-containing protein [Gloeotrichia echinulata DVL01]